MPIFITNFILPLALSVIRFYLYNSSSSRDGEVLDLVKKSIVYLSLKDNNSVTYGDTSVIGNRHYFGEGV